MKQYRLNDRLIYKSNCIRDMKCRCDVCAKWYEPVISQREYFCVVLLKHANNLNWTANILKTNYNFNNSIKKSTKFYMFAINNCKYIPEYSRKYQNYFLYIKKSNIVTKLYIYINLFYSILMYYNTVIIYWRLNIHILVCIYIYIYLN